MDVGFGYGKQMWAMDTEFDPLFRTVVTSRLVGTSNISAEFPLMETKISHYLLDNGLIYIL